MEATEMNATAQHPAASPSATLRDHYVAAFESFEKTTDPQTSPAIRRLRNAAIARFSQLGFPGPRNEDWRFTPLAEFFKHRFARAGTTTVTELPPPLLAKAIRLVVANGQWDAAHSNVADVPQGVTIGSLQSALRDCPDKIETHLGRYAKFDTQPFAALNTAFVEDGVFIHLPKGTQLETPIELAFVSSPAGAPHIAHPRVLVLVDEGASLKLVESWSGVPGAVYANNVVTEFVVGPGAIVDHYKVQSESTLACHVAAQHVQLAARGNFRSHAFTLGGAFTRNDLSAVLDGEDLECTLNGLYLADGERLVDNHTAIDHAKPHGVSHELYKGVLAGRGKGVFNGKIFVRQDAQKTDAKQTNQTLLLSDDATIHTKPQLEIFADDVKCTHGATVGQLDETSLFYLRARGIPKHEAERLLVFAFANDVVNRVQLPELREYLETQLLSARGLTGDRF
jgi:Fe-S cluster assembly protein SufD